MSAHFTDEQITSWLIGDRGDHEEAHLQQCEECKERVEQIQATLRLFRDSVHYAGAQAQRAGAPQVFLHTKAARFSMRWNSLAWVAMALVLIILTATPFYRRASVLKAPVSSTTEIADDAALMEQIDQETAEGVPDSLAPLADLMQAHAQTKKSSSAPVKENNHP